MDTATVRRRLALWEDDSDLVRVKKVIPWSLALHAALLVGSFLASWIASLLAPPAPVFEVSLMAPIKKGLPGGNLHLPALSTRASRDEAVLPDPRQLEAERSQALLNVEREQALKRALELAKSHGNPAAATATPTPEATPAGSSRLAAADTHSGGDGTGAKGDGGVEYGVWGGIPGSATYEQQVKAIVYSNFRPMDRDPSLTCDLRIFIEFNGKISHIENQSGSSAPPSFCAAAEVALRESDPLPAPPLETKLYLSHVGLLVRFHTVTQTQAAQP